jgi:hypothetical protein
MNPYAAIAIGVGVVLLAMQPRRGGGAAAARLPAASNYDWSTGSASSQRSGSPTTQTTPRTGQSSTAQTPTRTPTPNTPPSSTQVVVARPSGAPPAPRVVTPPGGDRKIAAIQTALNEIHGYIASASGRALHTQIAVTGRFDGNTFRAWNMLCQTAYGFHHARGCVPWFGPSYPLATAWGPAAPRQEFWADRAAFEAAVAANTPVTRTHFGDPPKSVADWLSRVIQNRSHDNRPMHLDALSDYWKIARQGGCWRYV